MQLWNEAKEKFCHDFIITPWAPAYVHILGTIWKMIQSVFFYRYMAAGKHIGKVLIKIRDEEPQMTLVPELLRKSAIPRVFCDPRGTYIIIGERLPAWCM